ncbi:MAG: Bug family tripartite tricarboxylate transporter substrate binding protein [Comamonadaceae bacterium]|nr:Bug family tripartite tricarboxylate transporter substrate binding protein [Comamonadaceae bacterium]
MTLSRRHFSTGLAAACLAPALPAWAQPSGATPIAGGKPVHLLVGFPPGGGTDVVARLLADKLKDALGQPVVVENRPGAGGQIAAQALKAATPDGLTLFFSHDHTISILPLVTRQPGFDPVSDFAQVAGVATFANALAVNTRTPARQLDEYVEWVQKQGGKGNVGIPAPASVPEFLVKLLAQKYRLDLVAAPYRGSAPMLGDLLGGQIDAAIGSVPELLENHKAGKLRVLATIGAKRQAALPDVPTFGELGLTGFDDLPYYGFFAPAGTPAATIERLSHAVAQAAALPDVQAQLLRLGLTPGYMTPEQLTRRARAYEKTWARIIRESGFTPQ